MKTLNTHKLATLALGACAAAITGCSMLSPTSPGGKAASVATTTTTGTTTTTTTTTSNSVSTTVPTADVIPGRIMAALTLPATTATPTPAPLVSTLTGNFATALTQQGPNLTTVADPATATGASAVPLIAFAACNDVTPAAYGVTTSGTITAQKTNIVNAGLTIVNQCTAGLAASGSLNTSVTQLFNDLITADSGTLPADAATYSPALVAASPAGTTAQAFISVCTAATSFCVSMLTF
jgi:hypothetical protein